MAETAAVDFRRGSILDRGFRVLRTDYSLCELERAADFGRDDTVEEKLGRLRSLLVRGARDEHEIELQSSRTALDTERRRRPEPQPAAQT